MIDKIQPKLPASYTNDVTRAGGRPGVAPEKGREIGGASAEVSLSGDALALQQILHAAKDAPDVRDDVVRTMRDKLAAGTYTVNAEALAERLLPLVKK
jgi:flagellar biosynthesis anti-sigma factor FlgM